MARRGSTRRRAASLGLAALMVGAIGIPPASAHFTQNPRHLGVHAWRQVIKAKVFTRKQANNRFYTRNLADQTFAPIEHDHDDGDFWALGGNEDTDPGTDFVGTTDDKALELHVNGERALRLEPDATSPNVIGGFSGNEVQTSGATIGGGGQAGAINQVTGDFGTVSGGEANTAGASTHATVGGGQSNTASGTRATVGGGRSNNASGSDATVGGGDGNTASGSDATVGGGQDNIASGFDGATVGGGFNNTASGNRATVGGGFNNTANSGSATVGGGDGNIADLDFATVGGGSANTASGLNATVPGGFRAAASRYGEMAHASGSFTGVAGTAQASQFVLRNQTTTDTATELFLNGAGQQLTLAPGQRLSFEALVAGGTAAGETAGYRITGLIKNIGGATELVGTPTVEVLGEDAGVTWGGVVAEADNTTDALVIRVTGEDGTTIRWVATVRAAQLAF